jgi:hypothetical protein
MFYAISVHPVSFDILFIRNILGMLILLPVALLAITQYYTYNDYYFVAHGLFGLINSSFHIQSIVSFHYCYFGICIFYYKKTIGSTKSSVLTTFCRKKTMEEFFGFCRNEINHVEYTWFEEIRRGETQERQEPNFVAS